VARATAASVNDESLRAQFEQMAGDWSNLAVMALAQEVTEAELVARPTPKA
jgi:hypothetical protein